jgi:hypothetical protein
MTQFDHEWAAPAELPEPARLWSGFSEDELELTRFAYQQVAMRIMDRAAADNYERADLPAAAATFHMASLLAGEVDVLLGEPTPDTESLEMVATLIASGETPQIAIAVDVDADHPFGVKADLPADAEEDDGITHAELVAEYATGPGMTSAEDR